MGLLVDVLYQSFGNRNDKIRQDVFFYPEKTVQITGKNQDLIMRLKLIFELISSGIT